MPLAVFSRASRRVLNILGQDSFLRGVPCGKVNIEFGVQVAGEYDDATLTRDIATVLIQFAPKQGDALDHPDGAFTLEGLLEDNGVTKRFVVLRRSV